MVDTDGNPQPFSRAQVNAKFNHWKATLNEELRGKAFVKDMVVSESEDLLVRMEMTPLFTSGVVEKSIVFFSKEDYPSHASIMDHPDCQAHFKKLRIDIIESVNNSLGLKVKDEKEASLAHDATELELIQQFAVNYTDCAKAMVALQDSTDLSMHQWSRVQALGRNIAREYIRMINFDIKLGHDTHSLASKINSELTAIHQDDFKTVLPSDNLYKETVYSVAGWLLSAARKASGLRKRGSCLSKFLVILVENCDVRGDESQLATLPTAKVEWSQLYENSLHFPSKLFFRFVAVVEKVCQSVFLEELAKVYGPAIVAETTNIVQDHDVVKECLDTCFEDTPGEECLSEVSTFLVSTYMNMRGKDYVRTIMGDKNKKSLTMGIRQLLQANTSGGRQAPAKDTEKMCYFCGKLGHGCNVCPLAEKPPKDGGPTYKVTHFKVDGKEDKGITKNWNWCVKCNRWQGHSTEQHEEKDECVQEAFEDLRQVVADDCVEMNEVIDECLLVDKMMDMD